MTLPAVFVLGASCSTQTTMNVGLGGPIQHRRETSRWAGEQHERIHFSRHVFFFCCLVAFMAAAAWRYCSLATWACGYGCTVQSKYFLSLHHLCLWKYFLLPYVSPQSAKRHLNVQYLLMSCVKPQIRGPKGRAKRSARRPISYGKAC